MFDKRDAITKALGESKGRTLEGIPSDIMEKRKTCAVSHQYMRKKLYKRIKPDVLVWLKCWKCALIVVKTVFELTALIVKHMRKTFWWTVTLMLRCLIIYLCTFLKLKPVCFSLSLASSLIILIFCLLISSKFTIIYGVFFEKQSRNWIFRFNYTCRN